MDKLQQLNNEIREYLKSRPAINRIAFEKEAGMVRNTLKDFISGKRQFQNDENTFKVVWALVKYGFKSDANWYIDEYEQIFGQVISADSRMQENEDRLLSTINDVLNY